MLGDWTEALLGDLPPERTPEQEAEWQACLADPAYFIQTYCLIKSDKGLGLIKFELFDYQLELLTTFATYRQNIVLKARQLGITELVAAYAVWTVMRPRHDVIVLSQSDDDAAELLFKAYTAWSNLPEWLRVPAINVNKTSRLELVNGSRIIPKPATKRAGRGLNAQLLVFDEWGFQEYHDKIFSAAFPTISAGGQFIGLSSANGVGDTFYAQWQKATSGVGMHPTFLAWSERPDRDQAWYEQQRRTMEPHQLAQEFPTLPDEAFVLSGRPRFDYEALLEIGAQTVAPAQVYEVGYDKYKKPLGHVRMWELPQPDHSYCVGADTAEGLAKGDYSAAVVLDYHTGIEVAELHGRWEVSEFAKYLAHLCRQYNYALLGVERNNMGHAVLLALMQLEHYPNLYQHREYDSFTKQVTVQPPGWNTSTKSKPIMIAALADAIRERRKYRNALFVAEARTYVIGDNGSTNAAGACFDDRVIAVAIAEQMRLAYQTPEYGIADEFQTPPGYLA